MIHLLDSHNLDFTLQDPATGDTAIHTVCEELGTHVAWASTEHGRPLDVACRAATSLKSLIEAGADPAVRNWRGESGTEAVRRVMGYAGGETFWRELAECWRLILVVGDGGVTLRDDMAEVMLAHYPDLPATATAWG